MLPCARERSQGQTAGPAQQTGHRLHRRRPKGQSSDEEILQISESVIDATYQQAKDLISERRKRENLAGKCQLTVLFFNFDKRSQNNRNN